MKSIYEAIPESLKTLALSTHFSRALPRGPSGLSSVAFRHDESFLDREVVLEKDGARLVITLEYSQLLGDRRQINAFWKRLPVMLSIFAGTNQAVRHAMADISDAGRRERHMCFCSNRSDTFLVPDRHFLKSGYKQYRAVAASHRDNWAERRNLVLWRGGTTGPGVLPTSVTEVDMVGIRPRARMCLLLRDVRWVDAKFSTERKLFRNKRRHAFSEMSRLGICGDYIPQKDWIGVKYALDIDGYTNSWVNLFVRLILGCCVIKVGSPQGFRQWYYNELVPWRHFVPVQPDMNDLLEKIEWCRTHDAESAEIAAAGQAFALSRTVESERDRTIARLNASLAE